MNFSTKVTLSKSKFPIDYSSRIVSLGSCFAVNMGEKLNYFQFQNTFNPFGIIFNPVAIEKLVERAVHEIMFTEEDVFFHNERFHCYEVHSDLSLSNKSNYLNQLNAKLIDTHRELKQATHVAITYGTSWVYYEKELSTLVANCHKQPQNKFEKIILSVAAIEKAILNTVKRIRQINPECVFMFTISPVRHIKDGFVENQRSKAHLITALQNLLSENVLNRAVYFPSYEIMMDELRDYRFYGNDFLHPSSLAIDYIWYKFKDFAIAETVFQTMEEVDSIQKSLLHRPFNPDSESHKKFIKKRSEKIKTLQITYPFMQFSSTNQLIE